MAKRLARELGRKQRLQSHGQLLKDCFFSWRRWNADFQRRKLRHSRTKNSNYSSSQHYPRVGLCMLCLSVFIWNLPAPLTVWQRNPERVLYLTDGPAQAKTRRPRRFSDTGEDLKPVGLLPVIRSPVVRPRVVRAAAAGPVAVVAAAFLIAQQARKRGSNGTGNRSHGVPRAAATPPVFLPRGR